MKNRLGVTTLALILGLTLISGQALADDPKNGREPALLKGAAPVNTATRISDEDGGDPGAIRYNCTGNRTITISRKVLTAEDGVIFRASGHCTLKLKDVVVTGFGIIEAKGDAVVQIEECSFTASSLAIKVSGNAELEIRNTVVSAPAGLVVSGNASVRLSDTSIASTETAIDVRDKAAVSLARVVTEGKRVQRGEGVISE